MSYQLSAISYQLLRLLAIGYWLLACPLHAQSLPAYAPINPAAASRSGLASQPMVQPDAKWRFDFQTDYASLIEFADLGDRSYLLDAEVLRVQLGVVRTLGRVFLLAEGSFNGSYDGFLDGFLNWYHNFTGFHVKARELRPDNEFAYQIHLVDGSGVSYRKTGGFLGDPRIGAGVRVSKHWQSVLTVTLPLSGSPAGYRRGVASLNASTTLASAIGTRAAYEGTLGAGYTPTHGELSDLQHSVFLMVTQGLRVRVSGALHAYGNLIYHSAYYHDTGMKGLDNRELTIDMGGMLRFKRGPEWVFGLTEDLEPKGPAVDLSFRLGARW